MMLAKSLLRELCPPVIWKLTGRFLRGLSKDSENRSERTTLSEYEWIEPGDNSVPIGYNSQSLVEAPARHFTKIIEAIHGPDPLGIRPGELKGETAAFWCYQAYPFAYAISRSLVAGRPLKVLDWGGGLGVYCHLARVLYPEFEFDYQIHETPSFAERGPEFTPQARFHSDASAWESESYDLVMASGSLQYMADWQRILIQLLRVSHAWVYLTRLPVFLEKSAPKSVLHRPRTYGYAIDVPFQVLPREDVLELVNQESFTLVREFVGAEEIVVHPDGKRIPYRGYLMQRKG